MNGLRTKEGKTRLQFPKEWHTAWRKANKKETRTLLEEGQSRAAEIAVTMGGATPLWTGNITKAWMWLLHWGNIPPQKKRKVIKEIRVILKNHANETWVHIGAKQMRWRE